MSHTPLNLIHAQEDLEAESRALGAARYRKQREGHWSDALGPEVDEASLPPGRRLLRQAMLPTIEAIRTFLQAADGGRAGRRHSAIELLAGAEPEPLAYLTLRCTIQAGVQQLRAQRAATMVARAVMDHLQAAAFERSNPPGAAGLQRSLKGRSRISVKRQRAITAIHEAEGVALNWSQRDMLLLGMKLIELATEATSLFQFVLLETGHGKQRRKLQQLQLADGAHEWLERQHERCELLDPIPMPMVVEPRPWTTPTDGGYLTPPIGNRLVRNFSRPYQEELAHLNFQPVLQAVNAIQATKWQINRQLLDVLRQAWETGGRIGGLPHRDAEPLPGKPVDFDENEEARQRWKAAAAEMHADNARHKSKRMALAQKLWVASKLADFPAVFFPHSLDFRGRVYPIPTTGPHPQDGDVGRALLRFAEGKALGHDGARWLAIHVANLFGVDKVSFAERVAWVDQHRAALLDSAANPLDGHRFWTTADKPWMALAACFEWAGYLADGGSFISHLPIAIDGSNSGLQHLTTLLRDPEATPHVNLVATERPGDMYAVVAAKMQAMVDASSDPDAAPWQNGRITRGIVKRPCMTYAYSATPQGMADQIRAELSRVDSAAREDGRPPHLGGADNFRAGGWLARQLHRTISETVPAARRAMDWLKSATKIINAADLPLWWTPATGMPVMQRYPAQRGKAVDVTFRGKRLQLQLNEEAAPQSLADYLDDPEVRLNNPRAVLAGIAPNLVHSLDAAHLMLATNAAQAVGITDLAVIHDSFGTHAANTDRLAAILRETFVAMYAANPLARFREELIEQLRHDTALMAKVPALPDMGAFDLRQTLTATYMFS